MATEDLCKIQLKDVRLSYPQLFKAKAFGDGDGEPAFSAEFLIPKDTSLGKKLIILVEDAIEEAKYKKWGDDTKKWPKIAKDKPFFKDGDDPDYERPETEDHMIVSARNYKKPRILGIDKEDLHESDGIIFAGCYVDAIVRVWAQDSKWGKRINCSLEAVRYRRDGEAFGAAPIDPDEFDDIDEGGDERRSSRRGGRDDDERSSSRRGGRDDDRGSSRRGSRDDDDGDDRGSSRRGKSRDDDDGDDKRSSSRGRDRDEEDDRGSSRRGSSRDDDGDRGSSRRSNKDDDDERSTSRRGRDDDERSSRRGRDEDEDDDDRGSRSRGSSRRGRDDEGDDGDDRPSRNSRSSSSRRGRDDDRGI